MSPDIEVSWWPTIQTMANLTSMMALGFAMATQFTRVIVLSEFAPLTSSSPSRTDVLANLDPTAAALLNTLDMLTTLFWASAVVFILGAVITVAIEVKVFD